MLPSGACHGIFQQSAMIQTLSRCVKYLSGFKTGPRQPFAQGQTSWSGKNVCDNHIIALATLATLGRLFFACMHNAASRKMSDTIRVQRSGIGFIHGHTRCWVTTTGFFHNQWHGQRVRVNFHMYTSMRCFDDETCPLYNMVIDYSISMQSPATVILTGDVLHISLTGSCLKFTTVEESPSLGIPMLSITWWTCSFWVALPNLIGGPRAPKKRLSALSEFGEVGNAINLTPRTGLFKYIYIAGTAEWPGCQV